MSDKKTLARLKTEAKRIKAALKNLRDYAFENLFAADVVEAADAAIAKAEGSVP